jgi:hypothetical protein
MDSYSQVILHTHGARRDSDSNPAAQLLRGGSKLGQVAGDGTVGKRAGVPLLHKSAGR